MFSRRIPSKSSLTRALSTRASHVLQSLGLPTSGELYGVYDGQWKGSGDITQTICPTTGELLASVRTASSQDLRTAVAKSREAYREFRSIVDSSKITVLELIYKQVILPPDVEKFCGKSEKSSRQRYVSYVVMISFWNTFISAKVWGL